MRKSFYALAALMVSAPLFFTSCNDDSGASYHYEVVTDGAYVVNSGNMATNIDGSLTAIDYATNRVVQNAFSLANDDQSLGSTPNDGLVYGNKMYIVVDGSNTVEVLDRNTLKRIKQISTTQLMGTAEGKSPRHIIAGNGHIFFTTYGGYVAAVDTTSFNLTTKYKVGSYPEGLAGYNNNIVVANSDYGQGNGNISIINLGTGNVETRTVEGINNPQKIFIINGAVYILDWSYYVGEWPNSVEKGESALKYLTGKQATKVADAYYASMYNNKFYIISDPYGTPAYKVCDVSASPTAPTVTTLNFAEKVVSPTGIDVDPASGDIFVLSYNLGEYGYADYYSDGYVMRYNNGGVRLHKYDVGVGPCAVFFGVGVKTVLDE